MNRSIRNILTGATVALGTLAAAGAAHAQPDAHVGIHISSGPHYEYAPRPYPGSAPVYVYNERPQRYAYNDDRRFDRRDRRCGAERWNPNVRYMPGAVVWRNGELYQARRISAQVYNENSPPEWTPNYWRPVDCR